MLATLRLGAVDADVPAHWRDVDVTGVAQLAAYERSAIWLYRRLRTAAAFDALPEALRAPLRHAAMAEAAMRLRVATESAVVLPVLAAAGIPTILIKGIARCVLADRYPYLDARATSDVDLLVPADQLAHAVATLQDHGYAPLPTGQIDHHHAPGMRRERDGISVELHSSTSVRVPAELAWERLAGHAIDVTWNGLAVRVPAPTELAWSAVAHALEDELDGFRLGRFLEVAALIASNAGIDWPVITDRLHLPELCDRAAIPDHPERVARRWLGCAAMLAADTRRPAAYPGDAFPLATLLQWRLGVLRKTNRLGRAATERLLEEGGRAMIGLPLQPSPAGTPWHRRTRRRVANYGSRAAFATWRLTRAI